MKSLRADIPELHPLTRYAVRVQGHLERRWADWLTNLTITQASDGTTLRAGPLSDQAALPGVLHKLRDLGLPLISVHGLNPKDEAFHSGLRVQASSGLTQPKQPGWAYRWSVEPACRSKTCQVIGPPHLDWSGSLKTSDRLP